MLYIYICCVCVCVCACVCVCVCVFVTTPYKSKDNCMSNKESTENAIPHKCCCCYITLAIVDVGLSISF